MFTINAVDKSQLEKIWQIIDNKAKPVGSLGKVEQLAAQLVTILSSSKLSSSIKASSTKKSLEKLTLIKPTMVVFCADHGINKEGVSTVPSEVTTVVAQLLLTGTAAINIFCQQADIELHIVDAGMKFPLPEDERIINQRLGYGTQAMHEKMAMTSEQVMEGFNYAKKLIGEYAQADCNVIGFGELGIGNTTSAAALMAAFTKLPAINCVGRGTGIDDETYHRKLALVEQALKLHQEQLDDPITTLACLGGFEIVQMCGGMLAAAEKQMVILVDGFIATSAALSAVAINPHCRDYMIFCHKSNEQGHQAMLAHLESEGLLDLGLCLGEGTGCALAMPILKSALAFYNDMAALN